MFAKLPDRHHWMLTLYETTTFSQFKVNMFKMFKTGFIIMPCATKSKLKFSNIKP